MDIRTVESSHYNFGFMHRGFVLIKEDSNSQFDLPSVRVINHDEMTPAKLETLNLFGVGEDGFFQTIDIEQSLYLSLTFGSTWIFCNLQICFMLHIRDIQTELDLFEILQKLEASKWTEVDFELP